MSNGHGLGHGTSLIASTDLSSSALRPDRRARRDHDANAVDTAFSTGEADRDSQSGTPEGAAERDSSMPVAGWLTSSPFLPCEPEGPR